MQKAPSIWEILYSNNTEFEQVAAIRFACKQLIDINVVKFEKISVCSKDNPIMQEITPLWYAVDQNKISVVDVLLENGADMYATSIIVRDYGFSYEVVEESLVTRAIRKNNLNMLKLLLKYGYDRKELYKEGRGNLKKMFQLDSKFRCQSKIRRLPVIKEDV